MCKKNLIFFVFGISFIFNLNGQSYNLQSKNPKPIDSEKAKLATKNDTKPEDEQKKRDTLKYGMASEIAELLDNLIKNDDPRFTNEIYSLFFETKNSSVKEKVFNYFANNEDPCLEYEAVYLLEDPYDEKNDVVKAAFNYVSKNKTKQAIEPIIKLIENENEEYFSDAITTLGEIGDQKEAVFIVEYLERDDLDIPKRQLLMRVCGKMHATETWGKLVDIIENDDENTFVRMYAAEAIGAMELEKSIPVLERNFDNSDPNFRQYIVKGLSYFPNNDVAQKVILQAIRDDHWKVRQEAIRTAKQNKLSASVPFIIHRVKNDAEKVIKQEAIIALGEINTKEGNEFLISQITDNKANEQNKTKSVEVLLKQGTNGEKEIITLAKKTVLDDKLKNQRYAIGKELAKYDRESFSEICIMYLSSKDTTTISLGLDMYKKGRYKNAEPYVKGIALDKKANKSCRTRAQNLLGIDEDGNSTSSSANAK